MPPEHGRAADGFDQKFRSYQFLLVAFKMPDKVAVKEVLATISDEAKLSTRIRIMPTGEESHALREWSANRETFLPEDQTKIEPV